MRDVDLRTVYLIAGLDALLGIIVFCICFCRAVVSNKSVLRRVRFKFVLLGPTSLAFGLAPLWGDWPSWINPMLLLAIVFGLLAETYQWRTGPPDNVNKDTMSDQLKENL